MDAAFENMTEDEIAFFERMKTAPEDQNASFRYALTQLMQCYGNGAPGAILATFMDRRSGELSTSGINLTPEEMLFLANATLQVIEANMTAAPDETAH